MALVPADVKAALDNIRSKADEVRKLIDSYGPALEAFPVIGAYVATGVVVVDTLDGILDLADDAADKL